MSKVAVYRVLAVVIPVVLLEAACRLGWINALTLPPPSRMAVGLMDILASGKMNAAILKTRRTVRGRDRRPLRRLRRRPGRRRRHWKTPTFQFLP